MSKEMVRLTLPFWGLGYCDKALKITLPALLAPGNLPALAEAFDVEISLVTESRLFDHIRESQTFGRLRNHATVRLVSLDDLLTGTKGDYGPVLTWALFRGFTDLGPRMCDTWLMFLNADFILADGSYRTAVKLMKAGHQVIHSPSFRVVSEDVMPVLESRIDPETGILAMRTRDMVSLALEHRHITVRARTVNQELCHQWRMDQFYWIVDDNTLLGYQCPVALVAIMPERAVTVPKLMFDYGVIPDLCPTAPKYFISDSDDFFMLEPQERMTGTDLVRLGGIGLDDIASDLSKWTTAEHHECLTKIHVFHGRDLPDGMEPAIAESKAYMGDLISRLGPPNPHVGHPLFSIWWDSVVMRINNEENGDDDLNKGGRNRGIKYSVFWFVKRTYKLLFGNVKNPRIIHGIWTDLHNLVEIVGAARSEKKKLLWILADNSILASVADGDETRFSCSDLAYDLADSIPIPDTGFDLTVIEIPRAKVEDTHAVYSRARKFTVEGGRILLWIDNRSGAPIEASDLWFCENALPAMDVSEVVFQGDRWTRALTAIATRVGNSLFSRPKLRMILIAATLVGLAPFCGLANLLASRKTSVYNPYWTSLLASFRVTKSRST